MRQSYGTIATVITTHEAALSRPRVRRSRGNLAFPVLAALALALVALLLLPTAHANLRSLAEVNGRLLSVPPSSSVGAIASGPLALARPGSRLDITGDVVALGGGTPVKTQVNKTAAPNDTPLADGSVVRVGHGDNVLERLVRKTESIPFKLIIQGNGAIVSQVQAGVPGKKTIYQGDSSRKQAAVFTVTEPQNTVLQRSSGAKPGQKLAALTFDDGPGKWTQGVLDALAGC